VLGGLVLSFELDWASGPSIVVVLSAAFALARLIELVRARRRNFA
jgi:ABC-type Mn2+/Zn2+ transport system permease subunit